MPRKATKKSALNARKAQLQFVEPPLHGAVHHCAQDVQQPCFSFKQVTGKRTSSSSWVIPQFETTLQEQPASHKGIGNRRRQQSCRSSLNKSSLLILPRQAKKTVCKPALSFKASVSSSARDAAPAAIPEVSAPSRYKVSRNVTCAKGDGSTGGARSVGVLQKGNVCASPHNTGTMIGDEASGSLPRSLEGVCRPLDSPSHTAGPSENEQSGVLVQDTPEQDYGLRVTWRRRKKLMMYLKDRGRLSPSETLVNI